MLRRALIIKVFLACTFSSCLLAQTTTPQPVHGLAMHGSPKYGPDFQHFEYANPDAQKGGHLRLPAIRSSGFDSLNPFIIKGVPAAGLRRLGSGYLYDSLTVQSDDEAFSQYGLVAETIEMPEDRSWVIFNLNPEAKFHDGHAITAEDVIFTFELLTKKGHPLYSTYYQDVVKYEAFNERTVKFTFRSNDNKELPLIMGQLPILPKHYWQNKQFDKSSLEIPLGSGPYRIKSINPGRAIVYERNDNYWAKDLPVNKGRYNFDLVSYDYYRDATVALEALKAGEYDLRIENTAKVWATGYVGKKFDSGEITKTEILHSIPSGMQGFVYNTRRWPFQNPKVRQALAYAFDFEWTNKQIFYNIYTRTQSYYENSELASTGLPSEQELAILAPYKQQIPKTVFSEQYTVPKTDGFGNNRNNIKQAFQLLKEAGWIIQKGKLVETETGRPMKFEILLDLQEYQRMVLPFIQNLKRLGINAQLRIVDPQQYVNRTNAFDFDMTIASFRQSSSPGNEQRDFWHSKEADRPGSRNLMGIKDPVVDKLIDEVISAPDREQLIYRTRALDRVLLWGHYVIPHFHSQKFRLATWNKFERPSIAPKFSLGLDNWWSKQASEP